MVRMVRKRAGIGRGEGRVLVAAYDESRFPVPSEIDTCSYCVFAAEDMVGHFMRIAEEEGFAGSLEYALENRW